MTASNLVLGDRSHLRVITNSELKDARACMRRHYYRYQLRRRPLTESTALGFGTLWHVGQQSWWTYRSIGAAQTAMAEHGAEHGTDPFDLMTANILLQGYALRWPDVIYTTVAVEQRFEVPLMNPETRCRSRTFQIGGKFDGIIRDSLGRLHVLEHKTTGSDIEIGSMFWEKVQTLDSQVSLYIAGAKASGYDVVDCVYDVVRKPGIRPLKATPEDSRKYKKDGALYANQRVADETPEEYGARLAEDISYRPDRYYARGTVVRLQEDELDSAYDTWQTVRTLAESERAGRHAKNPDRCGDYSGCPYMKVCTKQARIDDDTLFRTAATAHEELQTEVF